LVHTKEIAMPPKSGYTRAKALSVKESVLRLFAEGQGLAAVAREHDVSRQTIYKWAEDDESLSDTLERAKDFSLAFWDKAATESAISGKGNAPMFKMQMTNKHPNDYKDKREVDVNGEVGIFEIDFTGYDEDEDDAED
jgi:hypothetical protein